LRHRLWPGAWRAGKPPVSHPVFLIHPIANRRLLYANPGYAIRIDGWPERESTRMLDFLFQHQLQPQYRYVHRWMEHDLVIWDNKNSLEPTENP
jgi:taurine dioxygenase